MNTYSVKVPTPRQLGEVESIETLKHWETSFRNYYRRDTFYSCFLHEDMTWDPTRANHGLIAEGEESTLKRTALQLKADLIAFLQLTASYLPFSYVTERFENNTTSIKHVFKII